MCRVESNHKKFLKKKVSLKKRWFVYIPAFSPSPFSLFQLLFFVLLWLSSVWKQRLDKILQNIIISLMKYCLLLSSYLWVAAMLAKFNKGKNMINLKIWRKTQWSLLLSIISKDSVNIYLNESKVWGSKDVQ